MSAAVLREAAALMRERAKDAPTSSYVMRPDHLRFVLGERATAHIASWHPVVALAVADWLDHEVDLAEEKARYCNRLVPTSFVADDMPLSRQALTVARAYLGESPS